jgi:DNA sulfur modification protein DndB
MEVVMKQQEKYFELPAVKGIQAGKPYYSIMCPLHLVAKFFTYTDNSLPSNMRMQRILNKQRIPEMKDYILQNRDSYVFSSLTASVDGDLEFVSQRNSTVGQLKISMNSRIIINDGQHRRAAIEEALKECPELRYEDISIVIYYDLGLTHSQQMFTDLNRYAVRPTKSLNILYDNRDSFSVLLKDCITQIPIFNGSVENEKSSISNRSMALFTLSGIFHATRLFLQGYQLTAEEMRNSIISFWNSVAFNMSLWQDAKTRQLSPEEFRRDYICAHAITLKAIGSMGNRLLKKQVDKALWSDKLSFLQFINWSKDSDELQGLVIINGRISSSQNNQKAFAELLIEKSGWANITERV